MPSARRDLDQYHASPREKNPADSRHLPTLAARVAHTAAGELGAIFAILTTGYSFALTSSSGTLGSPRSQ